MTQKWLDLSNIPEQGREYTFQDQSLWTEPILEFALPFTIVQPLLARIFLLPQKKGCFVQGRFQGMVSMPCCRCAEHAETSLDRHFEILETLEQQDELDLLGPEYLRLREGILELDIAGLLWEQFVLSLPVKHLCHEKCLGICAECGYNLNFDQCSCASAPGDPRMAVFRSLKINKT